MGAWRKIHVRLDLETGHAESGAQEEDMRSVILHYHLFKNAGTSVDELLEENFPGKCVAREFSEAGDNNSGLIADWIKANPEAIAFSTHTGRGPVPSVEGMKVYPIMFFRDPIERLLSAYRFERHQDADTLGARVAKEGDFGHYVRRQLEVVNDRQCRNFQTYRLASLRPGPEPELIRASRALNDLALVGYVPEFARCFASFKSLVAPVFPDFRGKDVRANATTERNADATGGLDEETRKLLVEHNREDLELVKTVVSRLPS
jgi:hypothetical protein